MYRSKIKFKHSIGRDWAAFSTTGLGGGVCDAQRCTSAPPERAPAGDGAREEEKVRKHPSGSSGVTGKANVNAAAEFI